MGPPLEGPPNRRAPIGPLSNIEGPRGPSTGFYGMSLPLTEYLCNVMEDLGLAPSESLAGLGDLLKMDPKLLKSGPEGYPAPLVAAVKEMRKVK